MIIKANDWTFLVEFQFQLGRDKYICDKKSLIEVLEKYDINGVVRIMAYVPNKRTFQRISKKDILKLYEWDLESYEKLVKHYYFK